MAEVPVQPQTTPKGINWKTILISAGIGAFVIGIGALGFYLIQGQSKETTPTTVTSPKTSTDSAKQATPSAEKDDIVGGFRTYQNNDFGYSIKYPASYKQSGPDEETNDTNIYFESKDYKLGGEPGFGLTPLVDGVSIYINANKTSDYDSIQSSEDWEKFNSGFKLSNKRTVKIAGIDGFRYDFAGNHGEKLEVAVIVAKNNIYEFWFEAAEKDKIDEVSIFNDMLQTFKFTN